VKVIVGSVVAGLAASVCCIGPVVAAVIGAGTLGAASAQFEPYRPWFLGLTVVLLGAAFATTYRRQGAPCSEGSCAPASERQDRALDCSRDRWSPGGVSVLRGVALVDPPS